MSKIICDICGTTYPESSDSCPICGCSNTVAEDILSEETLYEEISEEMEAPKEPVRKKEIFDFDEVNNDSDDDEEDEDDEDDDDDDDEEEEEAPRHNTFVVILLTVLIIALLGAAGFIFFRYFLPNMGDEETVPVTTAVEVQESETVALTTEPTIPCQQMAMTNAGVATLNAEGQQFLLHIKALPENTTDKIVYTSADESIATVTEDGKITAVSEGETIIYISCGKHSIECPVIVQYVEETVPATTVAEETVPATTEALADADTDATVATEATEPAEATEVTEAPAETQEPAKDTAADKNVVLKLKRTDIQLGVYYQFQLVLDCALEPEEVTWSSEHPHIATVDEQGNVTAVKAGTTAITAKYGDQEVQCIVRCVGLN